MHTRITDAIQDWVGARARQAETPALWRAPWVGFASARDPLFDRLKSVVRPTHAHPTDLLPDAHTVIAWFVPFAPPVTRSNRAHRHASREWAVAYVETNALIIEIGQRLGRWLAETGYRATELPPTHNFDAVTLMSDWSHKHVAYIAGLGTFGRHQMLITHAGCAGRLGSLVTDALIEPSSRPSTPRCLAEAGHTCSRCTQRCATGALTETAFDRQACYALIRENEHIHESAGRADVCGKCVSGVPCAHVDPTLGARIDQS